MSLVFACLLQTLPVFPNIIWSFELDVLGIFPAEPTDFGHANLCLAVFTGIMHQVVMPEAGCSWWTKNFNRLEQLIPIGFLSI